VERFKKCQEVNSSVAANVHVLVCDEKDMQLGLGIRGHDVEKVL